MDRTLSWISSATKLTYVDVLCCHVVLNIKTQAVIEEHISKPRLMFENYPTYLVADTNCFVDHLDGLKAIVGCQAFILVVPLIGKNYVTTKNVLLL